MRKVCLVVLVFASLPALGESGLDWSGEIDIGYGYDSNVAVDDVDLATQAGDQFVDVTVSGGLDYSTDRGSLSAGLVLGGKYYNRFDEFDGRLSMLSVGVERELGGLDLGFNVRHIDYRLDHDAFLSLTQISPTLAWFPSRRTYVRAALEFSDEDFETDSARDNRQRRLSLRGFFFMNGLKRYLSMRIQHTSDDADDGLFDNDAWEAALTYRHELPSGLAFETGYRYQRRDYDEELHPLLGAYRDDRRRRFEARLEWPLSEKLVAVAGVHRNDYRSNLASADYDQRVYEISLKYEL